MNIQYCGSLSNDGAENKLTEFRFSHPLKDFKDLCSGLTNSLKYYGRVVQIKRIIKRRFFEGETLVILDRTPMNSKKYQNLDRVIYLMRMGLACPS